DKRPFKINEDFYVSTGGFCCFVWDLEGKRRNATLEDVRLSLKLADKLDQIAYTGLPVAAQDIPVGIRPVVMAAELAKATKKFGGIETFKPRDIEYISRIGEVVCGGKEEHRKNPILTGYAEARSPLCFDKVMVEVMLAHLEKGLPQTLETMPNAGATAPMSAAGTMSLGLAETLGGLVLGFAVDPNATMGVDVNPGYCDMRSMLFGYAGAERIPLLAARIQLISEYYGCPSGVHGGKTNSCVPGIQAGVEKGISMLGPVLAGAIGFGTVGHLENAITFSPLQLVIDNEIARYVRHCVKGIEVSDGTLDFETIREAGIAGNMLSSDSTMLRFKEEQLLSPFFDTLSWGSGNSLDTERFQKLAEVKARELLAEDSESPLTKEQVKAIDEIISEASKDPLMR
ncbi:MAG: trimethylamine methyltransferase family protein, partial [Candidatus Firestonebacteria bacterium]